MRRLPHLHLLRSRVRPEKHEDLKTSDLHIICKRKPCAKHNLCHLNFLNGKIIKIKAKHHHPTQKKYTPWIEPKDGTVGSTSFLDELFLKINARVIIVHNIDTADCLTNGQLGELVDVVKTKSGEIDKLVIKLTNKTAGKQNRNRFPGLSVRYPDCIFIERVSNQYPLRKKSGDAGSSALVIQFPVQLAFAITAHKIQGQTIPYPMKVALDLNSVFEEAQAHVMLSRVQCLDQVYITKSLDDSKIRTSSIGLAELERLKSISVNANPTPWNKASGEETIKISSLNCAGLTAHFIDILADEKLRMSDVIHLIETSLERNEGQELNIHGYKSHFINVSKGRGIVTYFKEKMFKHRKDFVGKNMQLTKFSSPDLDIINVYRSKDGNSLELLNNILDMMEIKRPLMITGDFNICILHHGNNRLTKGLVTNSCKQLIQQATHIRGGHIDHVYWKDTEGVWNDPKLEMYTPYYSDHDASLVTLTKRIFQGGDMNVK